MNYTLGDFSNALFFVGRDRHVNRTSTIIIVHLIRIHQRWALRLVFLAWKTSKQTTEFGFISGWLHLFFFNGTKNRAYVALRTNHVGQQWIQMKCHSCCGVNPRLKTHFYWKTHQFFPRSAKEIQLLDQLLYLDLKKKCHRMHGILDELLATGGDR